MASTDDELTPDGRAPKKSKLGGMLEGLFKRGAARAEPTPAAAKPRADFSNVQSGSSSRADETPQDQWYTVAAGDSLSKIAKRFYGDGNRWQKIFEANRDQIKDPDLIQPGQKLKIPAAQKSL